MNIVKDKKLLVPIIGTLIVMTAHKLFGAVINHLSINYYAGLLIKEIFFSAAVVAFAVIARKLNTLESKKEGLRTGLRLSIPLILLSLLPLFSGLFVLWIFDFETPLSILEIIMVLLQLLLIGFAEELMFRGTVQNCFHEYFGETSTKDVRKAILCTGALFGACHILNIFSGASFSGALIQAVVNIPMGILLCSIYFRSNKNLWVLIVLHAWWDFCGMMQGGLFIGKTLNDVISGYSLANLVMPAIFLLVSVFYLRDKKIEPLLKPTDIQ